jgi:hypothetical protein
MKLWTIARHPVKNTYTNKWAPNNKRAAIAGGPSIRAGGLAPDVINELYRPFERRDYFVAILVVDRFTMAHKTLALCASASRTLR